MSELDEVDVAVVVRRSGGTWRLDDLPDRALVDAESLVREIDRTAGDAVLGLLSVGDDFAVLVRAATADHAARLVVSDASAAVEWDLAASVLDLLGVAQPDDDADPEPAGDLALLADLGISADDLGALLDDEEHPDDVLVGVADEVGFGDELEDHLDGDEDDESDDVDDDAGDAEDAEDDDELDELEDEDLLDDLDDPFDDELEDDSEEDDLEDEVVGEEE